MNQKTQRLATIRKIIRSELIGSQEELIARLAECGINITQSTLSQQIKQLEFELGFELFLRNSRHVQLTEAGEEFLPFARKIHRGVRPLRFHIEPPAKKSV